ncbi:hypothetical protein [Marinifilum flexuosum]|uniref:hypothetical protein n=1 Tax=Marinifilum flexuosum TaxID=1117708 RepID=UPI0024947FA7|nr:hypothetical protein [Marinifilum flexuosum]
MKYSNIILSAFAFLGLGILSSCDVNDEFYDELDKQEEKILVDDIDYSMVEADYDFFKSEDDEEKNKIATYKSFSSSRTADQYLGEFLNDRYKHFNNGSTAVVEYDFYRGGLSYLYDLVDFMDELAALEEKYELTTADYDAMGEEKGQPGKYNNFDSSMDIPYYLVPLLEAKYPSPAENFMVELTYKFYAGSTKDVEEVWIYSGGNWTVASPVVPEGVVLYTLGADDYDAMGAPGSHDNFSSSEPANKYLPTFLSLKYPYAATDSKVTLLYRYYKGKIDGKHVTVWEAKEYQFDGTTWNEYAKTIKQTANFKRADNAWAFVPPITFVKTEKDVTKTYILKDADYELVGDGKYHNFYIKSMTPEEVDAEIIPKITKILKNNFDLAVGDIYEITYNYYDGTNGEAKIKLEAVEDK